MKIAGNDTYGIYVYVDHPPPHCHVRCSDGTTIVVALPTLDVVHGNRLSKRLRKLLEDNLEEIYEAWDQLNPNE